MSWKIERRASQQLLLKYKKEQRWFFFYIDEQCRPWPTKGFTSEGRGFVCVVVGFFLTLISWFFVPNGGLLNAVWTAEAYLLDRIIESTSCSLCSICCMRAWSNTSSLTDIGSTCGFLLVVFFVLFWGGVRLPRSPPE